MELVADRANPASPLGRDEVLWRRSREGDGDAFGMLFDRHRERVFRQACRTVDTNHDAEDVVAAAFLELWRRRDDVRLVDGSVLPWLLVTAMNLGRNSARGARRHRQLLERLPRARTEAAADEIAFEDHGLGTDPRLKSALRALKTRDAQLFALVALEGYPIGVAARQLKLTESSARSRLHRIRRQLRQTLGDMAPGNGSDGPRGVR